LAFALSGRRVVLSHLLLLAGVVGLALISNRNVLLLYWMATPIAVLQFGPRLRCLCARLRSTHSAPLATLGFAVAMTALLAIAGTAAAREPSMRAPTPFRFPIRSAEILARAPGAGAIFSADHQGGYLIWTLFPRFRPYMDTRLVLRTPQEFQEYLGLAENPRQFAAFQERHRFSYAILPVGYPDRYLPLIAHLYQDPEWKLIFTNGSETLFARRDRAADPRWDLHASVTTDRMLRAIAREFGASPRLYEAARISAATLDIALGEVEQAERILDAMDAHAARALRARLRLAAGDLATAQRLGERLLRDSSDDIRSLTLMAAICMRRGQLQPAANWLRRALAIDPFDAEAASLRMTMEPHDDP
jgi:tetratricopeptide (TPR) repeat protein